MARPRTDASENARAKELRKIADNLRDLADKIEAQEKYKRRSSDFREKYKRRFNPRHLYHGASGLLMDALALGGPEDEGLRRVLLSWKNDPIGRLLCFEHVCRVWRPLVKCRIVVSTSDVLACTDALRKIADGVSSRS